MKKAQKQKTSPSVKEKLNHVFTWLLISCFIALFFNIKLLFIFHLILFCKLILLTKKSWLQNCLIGNLIIYILSDTLWRMTRPSLPHDISLYYTCAHNVYLVSLGLLYALSLIIFLKTLALKNKKIFYATLVIVIILLGMVGYNIHKFIRPIPIEMINQAFQINKQIVLQTAHLDFSVIKWVS
jgi:hypothetical protein